MKYEYIKCEYTELVKTEDVSPWEKNRNTHTKEQIERLAKILNYQGIRKPLIVSNLNKKLVTGHGTLEAIKMLGWKMVPISYQDFENEDQQYAHMVADNAIASWADLDLSAINSDLPDLGPDLSVELFGIRHFFVDVSEKIKEINAADESAEWCDMPEFQAGDSYIRLILQFASENQRQNYVEKNALSITRKMNKQWIVNMY